LSLWAGEDPDYGGDKSEDEAEREDCLESREGALRLFNPGFHRKEPGPDEVGGGCYEEEEDKPHRTELEAVKRDKIRDPEFNRRTGGILGSCRDKVPEKGSDEEDPDRERDTEPDNVIVEKLLPSLAHERSRDKVRGYEDKEAHEKRLVQCIENDKDKRHYRTIPQIGEEPAAGASVRDRCVRGDDKAYQEYPDVIDVKEP